MISTPLLNSILSLSVISGASFYTSVSILSRKQKDKEMVSFAIFWLFVAIVFGLMAVRHFFFGMGLVALDRLIFYIDEFFVGFLFVPIMHHGVWKVTQNEKITKILSSIAAIFALLFLFFFFKEGAIGPKISDWGSEYSPPKTASLFFMLTYLIAFLFVIIDFIKRVLRAILKRKISEYHKFIATFSLVLFLSLAGVEELGIQSGWLLVFFRIIMMTAALIASFSYPKM